MGSFNEAKGVQFVFKCTCCLIRRLLCEAELPVQHLAEIIWHFKTFISDLHQLNFARLTFKRVLFLLLIISSDIMKKHSIYRKVAQKLKSWRCIKPLILGFSAT